MTEHFKVNKPDKSAEHSHMHLTLRYYLQQETQNDMNLK